MVQLQLEAGLSTCTHTFLILYKSHKLGCSHCHFNSTKIAKGRQRLVQFRGGKSRDCDKSMTFSCV